MLNKRVDSLSLGTELFLRALGLVFLCAFFSLAVQVRPLIGENGILPACDLLQSAKSFFGDFYFLKLPTLCWLNCRGDFLLGLCITGILVSLLFTLGICQKITALIQWVLFLSLVNVGNVFLQYQWEALLLEVGVISILLSPIRIYTPLGTMPGPRRWSLLLLKILLFKLMILSGLSKILSGDLTWRGLAALKYHFETQPLPTPLAWFLHHLPLGILQLLCLAMFFVELGVPFLFFFGYRLRAIAFLAHAGFQFFLLASGNYTYFNYLSIAMGLVLLDNRYFLRSQILKRVAKPAPESGNEDRRQKLLIYPAMVVFIFFLGANLSHFLRLQQLRLPGVTSLLESAQYYSLSNGYGLFAVMTTERNEIEIEGSDDGKIWKVIPFRVKPEAVNRAPRWVAPHQPRLDWQAWFAALGKFSDQGWLMNLLAKILMNDQGAFSLLGPNEFTDHAPKLVRVQLYRYHFSDWKDLKEGIWWTRELVGPYSPTLGPAKQ